MDCGPAISYRDETNDDLKVALSGDADGLGTWSLTILDSAGDVGSYSSLIAIGDRPVIAYSDATNGDLKFVIAP